MSACAKSDQHREPEPRTTSARGIAVIEQIQAALILVALADRVCGLRQRGHAAQEPTVGFVAVRDGSEALPPVAAQLVESAVVARPRVGVGGDGLVVGKCAFGQRRPRDRSRRMSGGHDGGVLACGEFGLRPGVAGKQYRIRSEKIAHPCHGPIVPCGLQQAARRMVKLCARSVVTEDCSRDVEPIRA